jgi:hypothetical protein
MINESSLYTIFAIIAGVFTIVRTIIAILVNKEKIFNEISLLYKFLIDKNQSIQNKINNLKIQILLSSVKIIKVILIFSLLPLSFYYMWLSDKCSFKCALYGTAIPSLQCGCKSIPDVNLFNLSVILNIYFWCLVYVLSYENKKKEPKKMDDDFVPYPIKTENEIKTGEGKLTQDEDC